MVARGVPRLSRGGTRAVGFKRGGCSGAWGRQGCRPFFCGMDAATGGLGGTGPPRSTRITGVLLRSVTDAEGVRGFAENACPWFCNRIILLSASNTSLFVAKPHLIPAVFQAVGPRRSVPVGPMEIALLRVVRPTGTGRERVEVFFFFPAGAKNGPARASEAMPGRGFFGFGWVGDAADLRRRSTVR